MVQIKIEIIGGSDDPETLDAILGITHALKARHPGTTVQAVALEDAPMRVSLSMPAEAATEVAEAEASPKTGEVVQLPEKAAGKGKSKKGNGTQKPPQEGGSEPEPEPKSPSPSPAPAPVALKPAEAREKVNDLVQRLWASGRQAQDGVKAVLDGSGANGVRKLEDTVIVEALDKFQVLAGLHLA